MNNLKQNNIIALKKWEFVIHKASRRNGRRGKGRRSQAGNGANLLQKKEDDEQAGKMERKKVALDIWELGREEEGKRREYSDSDSPGCWRKGRRRRGKKMNMTGQEGKGGGDREYPLSFPFPFPSLCLHPPFCLLSPSSSPFRAGRLAWENTWPWPSTAAPEAIAGMASPSPSPPACLLLFTCQPWPIRWCPVPLPFCFPFYFPSLLYPHRLLFHGRFLRPLPFPFLQYFPEFASLPSSTPPPALDLAV